MEKFKFLNKNGVVSDVTASFDLLGKITTFKVIDFEGHHLVFCDLNNSSFNSGIFVVNHFLTNMVDYKTAENLILKLKALIQFSDDALTEILAITDFVTVKKGALVQDIGKSCKNLYFIEQGSLRIFYLKDGNDITESFEFEGSFVARGESLLTMNPSNKGIEAIEDSQLFQINTPKLFALFATHLEIERAFHKIIEQAYIQQINRLESLQFQTAEQRYEQLIFENPKAIQRIPLKFIASFLGITQVSLSRIRARK